MQNQIPYNYQPNVSPYAGYSAPVNYSINPNTYANSPVTCTNVPACNSTPTSGVGAVNIQIFNPSAYPNAPVYYPYNYNNNFQQTAPTAPIQNHTYNDLPKTQDAATQLNNNDNNSNVAAQSSTDDAKKTDEKKKDKVILTDDYIKTLENYLNSQDSKIRLLGATELLERFKEDETRKDDAALTALLNKVLQDPTDTVKFVGLTALNVGYANGNNETAQILTNMQQDSSNYGEDARLASQILLKMAGNQSNKQAQAMSQTST